jgi:hypothetical protein
MVRKEHMNLTCTYCGYNSLRIVRDYTGAPYATCPRCYRANPFYRTAASSVAQTATQSSAAIDKPSGGTPPPAPGRSRSPTPTGW